MVTFPTTRDPSTFELIDLLGEEEEPFTSEFDAADPDARADLEGSHYWHVHRRSVIHQVLRSKLEPSSRCLELGCGTGNVATHLNREGLRVDYADLHRPLLEAAMRHASRELNATADPSFFRLDMTRQFPERKYDGVLLLDVLEHLSDPKRVLAIVREHLSRATDLVVVTVPAFPFLWSPWDEINGHYRRYTAESLQELTEGAGFRIERLTHFFFPLFFLAGAVKGLRWLRDRVRRPQSRSGADFESLAEARSSPFLNRLMGFVLDRERTWLRGRDLPYGTSLLCVARPYRRSTSQNEGHRPPEDLAKNPRNA